MKGAVVQAVFYIKARSMLDVSIESLSAAV